eukprot:IDg23665t1
MRTTRMPSSASLIAISTIFLICKGQKFRGHWEKTWSTPSTAKPGMNLGIAFSGENRVPAALQLSAGVYSRLKGAKYISFGGGNARGRWSRKVLNDINSAMKRGVFRRYKGIVYDVEEGDTGLSSSFANSFKIAKRHRLNTIIAVSHTAPYGISDGAKLMRSFLGDRHIDIISPIMYGNGDFCKKNNTFSSLTWQLDYGLYNNSKADIVPSLPHARDYSYARQFLQRQKVTAHGYIA